MKGKRTMKKFSVISFVILCLAACAASGAGRYSCRDGEVCACDECLKDPIFGRWAADLPGEKFDPAESGDGFSYDVLKSTVKSLTYRYDPEAEWANTVQIMI